MRPAELRAKTNRALVVLGACIIVTLSDCCVIADNISSSIIDASDKYEWSIERGGFYSIEDVEIARPGVMIAVGSHIIEERDGVWSARSRTHNNNILNDIEIVSDYEWIAVGSGGVIMKRLNDKITYNIVDTKSNLMQIEIANNVGIIAGVNNGIGVVYRMGVFGWKREDIPISGGLSAIEIVSDNNIWIAGDDGVIIRYDGANWSIIKKFTSIDFLASWSSMDNGLWLAGGRQTSAFGGNYEIWRFDNIEWQKISSGSGDVIEDMVMIDNKNGWAVGGGVLYKIDDMSVKIESIVNIDTFDSLTAILCDDNGNVEFVTSRFGAIFQSIDGAILEVHSSHISTTSLSVVSDSDIWIDLKSRGSLARLYEGVWAERKLPGILDIDSAGAEIWGVGKMGIIYHYSSGEWREESSPTKENIHKVRMISGEVGYAIANHGNEIRSEVLKYDNGSWKIIDTINDILLDIDELSDSRVVIIGDKTIYISDGSGWIKTITKNQLYSVDAIANNNIWAVGLNTIMHYNGMKWNIVYDDDELRLIALNGVCMIDENNGWAVGDRGIVLRSIDGEWSFARRPINALGLPSDDISLFDCDHIYDNDRNGKFVAVGSSESVIIWSGGLDAPVVEPTKSSITPSPTMTRQLFWLVYIPVLSKLEMAR